MKFTFKGSIRVTVFLEENLLKTRVSDTGIGISESD